MRKELDAAALRQISLVTLRHYNDNAASFQEGTRDHDVSQNVLALLGSIEGAGPFTILDLGCGPGRDLITFRSLGHEAVGLDGAEQFVEIARAATGCEVIHQDFLALDLRHGRFTGSSPMRPSFTCPRRSCRGSSASCVKHFDHAECSSPRILGETGRRAGKAIDTAPTTTLQAGADSLPLQDSRSSDTTTDHRADPFASNHGSPPSGAKWVEEKPPLTGSRDTRPNSRNLISADRSSRREDQLV